MLPLLVDQARLAPFMGFTSWAAFTPGSKIRVMGDMVLFEDEVNPVMSVPLGKGLEVTTLHNHFFFDEPKIYFMHIGGEGTVDRLAEGVRALFDKVKEIRTANAQPAKSFSLGQLPEKSSIEGEAISQVFAQRAMRRMVCIRLRSGVRQKWRAAALWEIPWALTHGRPSLVHRTTRSLSETLLCLKTSFRRFSKRYAATGLISLRSTNT